MGRGGLQALVAAMPAKLTAPFRWPQPSWLSWWLPWRGCGTASGEETAAQLAAQFGSGKETAAQLAAQFGGVAGKQTASKGRVDGSSSTGSGPTNGPGKRKDWSEGTVMAWCPNCGAAGGKGKRHDKFKAEGGGDCGRYSLSAPPAPLR
jgi:hypothetical protein